MTSTPWPERFLAMADAGQEPAATHVRRLPATDAVPADWPRWVPERLVAAYAATGIGQPWRHQVEAAELVWAGRSTIVSTGTATGKSLAYQVPVLSTLLTDRQAKALYLSPTKALGHDQLRAVHELDADPGGAGGIRAAAYDGDTIPDQRDWVREHSRWIFTNPDMLSRGILPVHPRWHMALRRLRYVVVDECHVYRGIFGSHVAHVLRRLRRLCAKYGAHPTFVLASATSRDPAASASGLIGLPCDAVIDSAAPVGDRAFALWEPPLSDVQGPDEPPVRRSAAAEAARMLADLVIDGRRTLVFVRSRRSAEVVTLMAQQHLREAGAGELAARVAPYRAGYLPSERRELERALSSGELLGVAATSALELGIDIAGLDAVVIAGFPGTLASMWQQAGRAGRRGKEALAVFVARDEPLDSYLVHHPAAVFDRPIEATVIDPANPHVLAPHLACAAYESPVTDADIDGLFGGEVARDVLRELAEEGVVRRRPAGWFYAGTQRPHADLRGSGSTVALVEAGTGQLIGTIDAAMALSTTHPGAVYLHRGETWVVDDLDLGDAAAVLHREDPPYFTRAQEQTDIRLIEVHEAADLTGRPRADDPSAAIATDVGLYLVDVEVTNQVVSFQRRSPATNEVLDQTPLDLPPRQLRTKAVLWTLSSAAVERLGPIEEVAAMLPGALHAAEHASIGLLPLIATCDRWDIGGVSTALHPDTMLPSVFVYDGHPGGAGFAEQGYRRAVEWLGATLRTIETCECDSGCPSCVQSPKCGNGNEPLHKSGAVAALRLLLARLPVDG